eukprot:TRINITY_DN19648_c0_g1_i4.p1 TRINITY_DN19648_c0_g1~~TRINITY_DN19648_c0_g1_i4.p1  ORF type:complete len:469 (-),score=111.57 TRINITY_DN19648_c0_g1_i4:259-1665(-)
MAACDELGPADLGVDTESDAYVGLVEELGGPPPWPAATVQSLFDCRYPGWDEMPKLSLSSPITKLRGLAHALESDEAAEEGIHELGNCMKSCQLRLVCDQRGIVLQDECSFLLLILQHVGSLWLCEREERIRERKAAIDENNETLARVKSCSQEATALAREEVRKRLEELAAESEAHQLRADSFEREVAVLQNQADRANELEEQLEAVTQDAYRLKDEHTRVLEDLREAKASKYALVIAHQESEGAYEELSRRLSVDERDGTTTSDHERSQVIGASKTAQAASNFAREKAQIVGAVAEGNHGQAFVKGARAALALAESVEGAGGTVLLRASLLAWRCAMLQAKYARIGANAAAESLEADLAVVGCGGRGKLGRDPCCCSGGAGDSDTSTRRRACCRERWLTAALQALHEQLAISDASAVEAKAALTAAVASRSREMRCRTFALILGAASICSVVVVAIEPYLDVGNVW